MIRINLLPHRVIKRAQRRRDFYLMSALALGSALVLIAFVGFVISGYISNQQDRNSFIKAENAKLDEQIKEISSLRQEIDALKARQQAVEDLQSDRNLPVHLLDEMVKQVPEGVYLTSMRQDGLKVTIVGLAQSNDRVSELLRNLGNNSTWLQNPELIEIKSQATQKDGKRLNQFTIVVSLKRPSDKEAGKTPAAGATGGAATGKVENASVDAKK